MRLLVPCYMYKEKTTGFLVDALFLGKVERTLRNTLFVYPCENTDFLQEGLKLKPRVRQDDVIEILEKAKREIDSEIVKKSVGFLRKFRVSMIIPARTIRVLSREKKPREEGLEGLRAAKEILRYVLKDKGALFNPVGTIYVPVTIYPSKQERAILVASPNKVMARNYEWLYTNDGMFRREIESLLGKTNHIYKLGSGGHK